MNTVASESLAGRAWGASRWKCGRACGVLLAVMMGGACARAGGPVEVELARVPDGGIQPQMVVGGDGAIHLLYFRGDPAEGDLYYVRRGAKEAAWDTPVRVNSVDGSAVATGNDRGGHIALGRGGAVHVAWNGSRKTVTAEKDGAPMLYARLVPGASAFEAQRNVMAVSDELDGGGSVAADAAGHVYVVWHGLPVGVKDRSEASRRVFVAASADDGKSFGAEVARSDAKAGACGCCGLKASVLAGGELAVLYRSAEAHVHRDEHLLRLGGEAKHDSDAKLDGWELGACPMSTSAIAPCESGTVFAWETRQDIRWAIAPAGTGVIGDIHGVGAKTDARKYPAVAMGKDGRVLVAWVEGMRWGEGGRVHWSVFDAGGKEIEGMGGKAEGVPAWSLVAAAATDGGGFLVLY